MINVNKFYNILEKNSINFFTGVPDSTLKSFCAYLEENSSQRKNIIAANEGNALAIAVGYYLATKKIGLVYMQNSGLGNAVNPLTSLTDPLVYNIPVLLMIGWRGEPDKKDEPQHKKQGEVTLKLLETLGIEYEVLNEKISIDEVSDIVNKAIKYMTINNRPYALVISRDTFEKYDIKNDCKLKYELTREEAIKLLVSNIEDDSVIVSTTGKASRELFEHREVCNESHEKDFLTVGSMGHASQIALGIALAKPNKMVYCLDGDGALIMHMGALAINGDKAPENYKHIIINNGAHDSVGGQPTVGFKINIPAIASAGGYNFTESASTKLEVLEKLELLKLAKGPALLEIKVNKGSRSNLGRPKTTPIFNKEIFVEFLSK